MDRPGDVFLNADFGYQPPPSQHNSIGDKVWLDVNDNKIGPAKAPGGTDTNEYGIPGVTLALIRDLDGDGIWDAGDPIIATTLTDGNGEYLFTGLPDGSYLVWVNDTKNVLREKVPTYDANGGAAPAGSGAPIGLHSNARLSISSVVDLGVGDDQPATNLDQDFGYTAACHTQQDALIGDKVWLDLNSNGVGPNGNGLAPGDNDGEPGLGGLTVRLFDSNNIHLATRTTDRNGNYYFGGLQSGSDATRRDDADLR
jgi:hypothetical protein